MSLRMCLIIGRANGKKTVREAFDFVIDELMKTVNSSKVDISVRRNALIEINDLTQKVNEEYYKLSIYGNMSINAALVYIC